MGDVEDWSDQEIRDKFKELGVPITPITRTTRKLVVKKLRSLLDLDGTLAENTTIERSRRKTMPAPMAPPRSPGRRSSPGRSSTTGPIANSTFAEVPTRAIKLSPVKTPPRMSHVSSSNIDNEITDILTTRHRSFTERPASTDYGTNVRTTSDILKDISSSLYSPVTSTNKDYSPGSSQPFVSEFMKNLSANRPSYKPEQTSPSGILSRLDIKESDDEDSGPTPVYAKFSQGSFRGFDITHSKGSKMMSSEGWFSLDSPISAVLLLIFLAFFTFIGITYVNMHFVDTGLVTLNSDLNYPPCLKTGKSVPGENCITEKDKDTAQRMFSHLLQLITQKLANMPCSPVNGPISFNEKELIEYVLNNEKTTTVHLIMEQIKNLKVLVDNNPKFKIKATMDGFIIEQPPVTYYCSILNSLQKAALYTVKTGIVVASFWALYLLVKWWFRREARHKEEVYKLVGHIVELVSSQSQGPDSCIPIIHIRDQLIPPQDRSKKAKLWKDAVALLDTDSRIRCDVQEVDGENFLTWRWLASTSLSPSFGQLGTKTPLLDVEFPTTLRQVLSPMIWEYMKSNMNYTIGEIRQIVSDRSLNEQIMTVKEVYISRKGHLHILQANICIDVTIKVSMIVEENAQRIHLVKCDRCEPQGGCKHSIVFLLWLHVNYGPKLTNETKTPSQLSLNQESRLEDLCMDVLISKFKNLNKPLLSSEFLNFCQNYIQNDLCLEACMMTKDQSDSPLWFKIRSCRITASQIYTVARCKTDDGSTVRTILGRKIPMTRAMLRGQELEKLVIEEFMLKRNLKVFNVGFLISSEYPEIGASPDGIGKDFVVEVKCPTSTKTVPNYIQDGIVMPKFKIQIQLQMFVFNKNKGYFIVADPDFEQNKNITIIDESFVMEYISSARKFWEKCIFPKLIV